MSYEFALARVIGQHRSEIEAELITARAEREVAQVALEKAVQRVHMLEGLLQVTSSESIKVEAQDAEEAAGKMTLHAAMQKVLRESPTGRLRAGEIIAEIARLNLYRMRDGRLPESQQIHARASHYPELFGKDGSYFYAK